MIPHEMTTSAFEIAGFRVTRNSGIVRGRTAIIGVRYDATEIMQGVTEVLCYRTATLVEPIRG